MKKAWKLCTVMGFLVTVLLTFSLSVAGNAYYDPDGTASEEFLFDAAECDRTVLLNCVDEEGTLIKQVYYRTKKGEEDLISFALYGYDLVAFESDQGLWETCKITWCTGVNSGTYLYVQLEYVFRSGLSRDVLTATATVRKAEAIQVVERHYLQKMGYYVNARHYVLDSSSTTSISYYDPVSWQARIPTGYHMKDGYLSSFDGTFSYTWLGKSENLPYDNFEYDWINTTWAEGMKSYNSFDESKDGPVDYCKDRVLYVDFYYDLDEYTLSFDANGGEGAPADMVKPYGFDIVIPSESPARQGFFFKGWGVDATATEIAYCSGDSFSQNSSQVLYAVWEKDDYEFSAEDLTVNTTEIFPNSIITVRVRTDSWDQNDAYADIPVELYYDGRLLTTEWVDFEIYGVAYVTFQIDVGTVTGEHEIKAQINRAGITREENKENNTVTTVITVKKDEYAFGITAITGNSPYTEGVTVMTSYLVSNDGERSVLPDVETPVTFTVFYYGENGEQVVVNTQGWKGLAIPYGEQNLVYFKWTVPNNFAGITVYCECTVNADGALKENNRDNNAATLVITVAERRLSQTPNPIFTTNAPSGYTPQSVPAESVGSTSWTMWEYEDGAFVLKKYGIKIDNGTPTITPDGNCTSATYGGGVWTMKSGYGITLNFAPALVVLNGCSTPDQSSYTDPQSAYATFSEYGYSTDVGEYRDLVSLEGEWYFAENEGADQNDRIHYIPLWLSDGEYIVSVTLTEIWTPVGRITAVRSSNVILIDGSLYDDWYN